MSVTIVVVVKAMSLSKATPTGRRPRQRPIVASKWRHVPPSIDAPAQRLTYSRLLIHPTFMALTLKISMRSSFMRLVLAFLPFARATACVVSTLSVLALALPAHGRLLAGTNVDQSEVTDDLARVVTYYVSRPKEAQAPILLMIQGSGCSRVLEEKLGNVTSTVFNLMPQASEGRFTVVAVEKPHSIVVPGGVATGCTAAFNADFTAERWLVALQAALRDARKSPWVDPKRTLVFGHSEGAVMAAMLAARDHTITDVISIGGSGTTQLFDFVASAYRRCFDVAACLADIDRDLDAINAKPDSPTDFAWGHPHKRWSSFLRVDPGAELLRSNARIYMAFGTNDESVAPLSAEHAIARLRLASREVTVRRVPNAGHSLADSPNTMLPDMRREYKAAFDWFWARPR